MTDIGFLTCCRSTPLTPLTPLAVQFLAIAAEGLLVFKFLFQANHVIQAYKL